MLCLGFGFCLLHALPFSLSLLQSSVFFHHNLNPECLARFATLPFNKPLHPNNEQRDRSVPLQMILSLLRFKWIFHIFFLFILFSCSDTIPCPYMWNWIIDGKKKEINVSTDEWNIKSIATRRRKKPRHSFS